MNTSTSILEKRYHVSPLIQKRWACPRCKSPHLIESDRRVSCNSCQAAFTTYRGIPLFIDENDPTALPKAFPFEISIIVLALNEENNLKNLLKDLKQSLIKMDISYELIVIDGGSNDRTVDIATSEGAKVIVQSKSGYGQALREGFNASHGRYVLTMDADLSHPAEFLGRLWQAREKGELVVASRYVEGAQFDAPVFRKLLSRILNMVFTRALSVPIKDISSGFRLYRREVLQNLQINGTHFEALEELLIKIHMNGWRVTEIPFNYAPRRDGKSKVRLITFGICFLRTFFSMWALRASIASADYDERAFNSIIPLQRYWQRMRHKVILRWAKTCQDTILDVGCGSSRIIQDIPNIVGLDVALYKLRYTRQKCESVVQGSIFDLPFADQTFGGAICSQVIEHIPGGDRPFQELARVLKPGGLLIIGTPDYGRPYWPFIEAVYKRVHPDGYVDEHITHYTLPTLRDHLERAGFEVLDHHYIMGAELNVLARRRSLSGKVSHDQ